MYRIALNVAISFYRKGKIQRSNIVYSERLLDLQADADDKEPDDVKLMFSFISTLKDIDKSIILLYLEDKSHREIASIVGISETNVATRMGRIKERLRSDFQKHSK